MCSSPPKAPSYEAPEPIEYKAPEIQPLPTPRQAQQLPPAAPSAPINPTPAPPIAPVVQPSQTVAPPAQTVNSTDDEAIVKRRKSKRRELQQASSGTDALKIPLAKGIGSTPKGSTGSSGLNIPR